MEGKVMQKAWVWYLDSRVGLDEFCQNIIDDGWIIKWVFETWRTIGRADQFLKSAVIIAERMTFNYDKPT